MKRVELLNAMKDIVQGVEKVTSPEGMDYVLIDRDWMRSFNDTISVSYPIKTGLHCAVKAQEFYQLLSKYEGEDVTLTDEGNKLLLASDKAKARLLKFTSDKFAAFESKINGLSVCESSNWIPITPDFSEGANFCLLSAASEGRLEGVAFFKDTILSSDNLTASQYISGVDVGKFVLSSKILIDLLKISNKWKFICKDGAWVHLKEDNLVVSAKVWTGENYPAELVKKLFSPTEARTTYEFPEGIIKIIERAEVLASSGALEGLTHLTLRHEEGELVVKCEKTDVGDFEERIAWPEKAMPANIELSLSPVFLKKILSTTRTFSAGPKSVMLTAGNYSHMMVASKTEVA